MSSDENAHIASITSIEKLMVFETYRFTFLVWKPISLVDSPCEAGHGVLYIRVHFFFFLILCHRTAIVRHQKDVCVPACNLWAPIKGRCDHTHRHKTKSGLRIKLHPIVPSAHWRT